MKIRLTSDEMLEEWRKRRGIGPFRSDSTIKRTYGIDMDAVMRMEMRDWYVNLLHTATAEMLAPVDCHDKVDDSGGDGALDLPDNVVRVLSVKMTDWRCATRVVRPTATALRRAANPYAATRERPMAIFDGHRLYVTPYTEGECAESVICITDEGPEVYRIDELALATIKPTAIYET